MREAQLVDAGEFQRPVDASRRTRSRRPPSPPRRGRRPRSAPCPGRPRASARWAAGGEYGDADPVEPGDAADAGDAEDGQQRAQPRPGLGRRAGCGGRRRASPSRPAFRQRLMTGAPASIGRASSGRARWRARARSARAARPAPLRRSAPAALPAYPAERAEARPQLSISAPWPRRLRAPRPAGATNVGIRPVARHLGLGLVPGDLGAPVVDALVLDDRPALCQHPSALLRVATTAQGLGAHALVDREILRRADLLQDRKAAVDARRAPRRSLPASMSAQPRKISALAQIVFEVAFVGEPQQPARRPPPRRRRRADSGAASRRCRAHAEGCRHARAGRRARSRPRPAGPPRRRRPCSHSASAISPSAQTLQSWPP